MRGLMFATRFDTAKRREQLLRRDRRDRSAADVGVQKAVQPRGQDVHRLGSQALALQVEPLASNSLERISLRSPLRLTPRARVDLIGYELPRVVAFLASAL